ncbi:uncharacterized protein [Blastocystis hominis]|uniref:Presenilin n=1 Tax=Blastocystis hominis TaxID=12968 RepID=D8MAA7_BLAHO|nr:uncharacterized protein [Blastocystis hominis]CBK24996.2 unnamed protein product [Blastocystis hominis]|eukprot:XP_012899044.1 uncharacterized protein [Blastocystis hominis]
MSQEDANISPSSAKEEKNLLNDSTYVIWYGVNHLASIVIPVGLTMLFSAILVNVVRPASFTSALEQGLTVYMVYKQEADNTWDSIWQAVINSLVIVLFIGLMTFIMVILYKYNCIKVLYGLLYFSTFMAIGYTGWVIFYMAAMQYQFSCDLFSSAFIFFNLGVVSVISIFGTYAPPLVKKAFLIFISCLVCYLLSFFPDWTTWILLIAMALYDICAVLTPCGPLKLLINISQNRDDAIPGLLYETTLDHSDGPLPIDETPDEGVIPAGEGVITDGDYVADSEIEMEEGGKINRIFEKESVSLGLGDFIFYSLMVSKASLASSVPFVFVFVIILTGLLLTMAFLSVLEMALPALPFSMILGVVTYALTYFVVTAMTNQFALNGVLF